MKEWEKHDNARKKMLEEQIKKGCDKCSQWDDYFGCDKCDNSNKMAVFANTNQFVEFKEHEDVMRKLVFDNAQ